MDTILQEVADAITSESPFFPDLVDLNSAVQMEGMQAKFVDFFARRDTLESPSSAFTLKGRIGVGKSSFLHWWCHADNRSARSAFIDINGQGLRLQSSLKPDVFQFIPQHFCQDLSFKLSSRPEFVRVRSGIVQLLQNIARAGLDETNSFEKGLLNQTDEFRKQYPAFGWDVVLGCTVAAINRTLHQPVWLILDNIDMEGAEIQNDFIRGAIETFDAVQRLSENLRLNLSFHLVITAREGTYLRWQNHFSRYKDITYPVPNLMAIVHRRLEHALAIGLSEKRKPELGFSISSGDVTITSKPELREYLLNSMIQASTPKRWPWSSTFSPQEWHLHLTNFNVRRFLTAWVHIMCSSNFVDSWAFPETRREERYPSPYQYVRLLIRGRFVEFPGNHRVDGSGHNADSPLFFNVFGFPLRPGMSVSEYCAKYLCYVRMLQYLHSLGEPVRFSRMKSDLSPLFGSDAVVEAVQTLLWVRLIDEGKYGFIYSASWTSYEQVSVEDDAMLEAGETARLYLEMLLCEYSYISTMALVSYQLKNEHHSVPRVDDPGLNAANATVAFLESLKETILLNLADYRNRGVLEQFKEIFFLPQIKARPWSCAVAGAIHGVEAIAAGRPQWKGVLSKLKSMEVEGTKAIREQLQ